MDGQIRFFNPRAEIAITSNRLPHWEQDGGTYFVTFRLADSLPKDLLQGWITERDAWLRLNPKPWSADAELEYRRRFVGAIERWIDAGHGACLFRRPECAAVVVSALPHFDGVRYRLTSFVVMPNHVHVLFSLYAGESLEAVIRSWKIFSAHRINCLVGATGHLWQRDYFDRLVRDAAHFARCVRYIRGNPAKAKLRPDEYILFESDLARTIE